LSLQTYGWLILAFPLGGGGPDFALTFWLLPWRVHGWIGTLAILLSFLASIGALVPLQDRPEEERQVVTIAWNYANTVGVDAAAVAAARPAVDLHGVVVSGVSTLIHLYSVSTWRPTAATRASSPT
jgi:NADH-quinone oxidoreductase subunit L